VAESELSAGQLLVDVGCGRGGAGLHVAERTGARLLGLDISAVAVEEARARAVARGLAGRASFRVGEFERTGLDEASVRVVMSVDALTFAEDKAAALRELARVLEPSGRLLFTSWDYRATPPGRPPQVADHRPLLAQAGFEVLAYEETALWRERWRGTNLGVIAEEDALAAEVGAGEAASIVERARRQLVDQIPLATRRVLVVARRV
ncbi:MAG: class I SAM-dependent methyltransferase, partial [Pseudonocardiaceae bacterium]